MVMQKDLVLCGCILCVLSLKNMAAWVAALHWGKHRFKSWLGDRLYWNFLWFSSVHPGKC